jgi:NADPH:quinone reductase-like Zn-dependent oxidoreductase
MACKIPDTVPFENAVVLGLGLSTAADALFNPDFLNLQLPTEPAQKSTSKTLLVWGGASTVGSNAIQLAVAAGYEVITTASPKNFEYVKKLGANYRFDYNSPTVISELVNAFKDKISVGAFDAIGAIAWTSTLEVIQKTEGIRFVATVDWGFSEPPKGITMKKDNHVGKAMWEDFLPKALEAGSFVPAPEPLVAGTGLESLQRAIDF